MKIHIVQKGDTLWKLSKKYGVSFEELKQLNSQLSNPDMIMPGMKIKIPGQSGGVKKEMGNPNPGTATNVKEAPIMQAEYVQPAENVQPAQFGQPAAKEQPVQYGQPAAKEQPAMNMPKVKEQPFVMEQIKMKPKPAPKEQPIVKEKPVVKEKVKEQPIVVEKPVVHEIIKEKIVPVPQPAPKPIVTEVDINNYYITNMQNMAVQQPAKMPPVPPVPNVPPPPGKVSPIKAQENLPAENMPAQPVSPVHVQPLEECVPVTPLMPVTGYYSPMPQWGEQVPSPFTGGFAPGYGQQPAYQPFMGPQPSVLGTQTGPPPAFLPANQGLAESPDFMEEPVVKGIHQENHPFYGSQHPYSGAGLNPVQGMQQAPSQQMYPPYSAGINPYLQAPQQQVMGQYTQAPYYQPVESSSHFMQSLYPGHGHEESSDCGCGAGAPKYNPGHQQPMHGAAGQYGEMPPYGGSQMGMQPQYGSQYGSQPQYGAGQYGGQPMHGAGGQYGDVTPHEGSQMGMQPQYGSQYGGQPQYGAGQYGGQPMHGAGGQYGDVPPHEGSQMGMQPQYGSQYGGQPQYGAGQYGGQPMHGAGGQYGHVPPYEGSQMEMQPQYGAGQYGGQPMYGPGGQIGGQPFGSRDPYYDNSPFAHHTEQHYQANMYEEGQAHGPGHPYPHHLGYGAEHNLPFGAAQDTRPQEYYGGFDGYAPHPQMYMPEMPQIINSHGYPPQQPYTPFPVQPIGGPLHGSPVQESYHMPDLEDESSEI
ncbi:SafA/ExsA family spore coat assembly protein [Peribacillus sp. SCS-155]|uniref:SafA/ExsA family spore coat assembly protein n=1 Tax=Peribacillus sedimenti TaxID=3115297 RepID=UPI003905A48A